MSERILGIYNYQTGLAKRGRLTPIVQESVNKAIDITRSHQLTFYIAGALTGVSESVKSRYEQLSAMIGRCSVSGMSMFGYAPHLHGTDPVRHPQVTPNEVRDIDYLFAVKVPDYHINLLDPMAHGNAIEQGWAESAGIPSVYMAPTTMRLSRLVLGMQNIRGLIRYDDFETDGLEMAQSVVEELRDNTGRQ